MAHLREAIAMVLQKNTLFSGSLLDNLRWGKEDASMEEIEEACRIACVDEVLERLPEGYETEMGQGGVNVSGGQKQRICIARALLKDAPIVLLDEATASLDVENETRVQEALSRLLAGKTVLVIAHRMRTVAGADHIVVLENGHVVLSDTGDALLANEAVRSAYLGG